MRKRRILIVTSLTLIVVLLVLLVGPFLIPVSPGAGDRAAPAAGRP